MCFLATKVFIYLIKEPLCPTMQNSRIPTLFLYRLQNTFLLKASVKWSPIRDAHYAQWALHLLYPKRLFCATFLRTWIQVVEKDKHVKCSEPVLRQRWVWCLLWIPQGVGSGTGWCSLRTRCHRSLRSCLRTVASLAAGRSHSRDDGSNSSLLSC